MKQMKKTVMATAIAAGLASGGAFGATVSNPASGNVYGTTIVDESVRTIVQPAALNIVLGAGEAPNVDDSIDFELSGGAEFAAIASGDLTGGGGVFALITAPGANPAKFRVTTAPAAGSTLTLAATATIDASSVAAGGDVTNTVTIRGFVGGTATDLFGSPLASLAVDLQPTKTAVVTTSQTGIFDVAAGFQQLTSATSADAAAPFNSSQQAVVTVTTNANATAGATTTAPSNQPVATPTPSATLFTMQGPMSKIDTIDASSITSSTSTGGVPTGGTTATELFIDTANDSAYGTATAGPIGAQVYNFTINFDEDEVHDTSAYSIDVDLLADTAGGYAASGVLANANLFTFTRNGSAFTSNTIGPLNKVSITDRSGNIGAGGADGAISISAFDTGGNAITCSPVIADLPNNGTVVFDGTAITDACPGAKRIEGIVNSTSILVTNVKTTADGATASPATAVSGGTAGI